MKYSLEATIEASRLEEQVFQDNYSIHREMDRFSFNFNEVVLDAGCGTGVLSRYLVEHFNIQQIDAIDASDLRLKQASEFLKKLGKQNIKFYRQDLSKLDEQFYNKYDTVICRYVLEHVEKPDLVLLELKKALKKNGRIILFDLDGVFVNLYSENKILNKYMTELKESIRFDLEIGRKLPVYLKQAGFSQIQWDVELLSCKNGALHEEKKNTEKRFIALEQFLTDVLGSSQRFEEFRQLYLDEMRKPENTLVFTKYICSARNS